MKWYRSGKLNKHINEMTTQELYQSLSHPNITLRGSRLDGILVREQIKIELFIREHNLRAGLDG